MVEDLKREIEKLKPKLPPGVRILPHYDRTELVAHTVHTVTENLAIGAGLVVAILVIFLRNLYAALAVATVIPLSLLFAFVLMDSRGVAANLISLGAVDFGIIIDSAVVLVEALMVRLAMGAAENNPLHSGYGWRLQAWRIESDFANSSASVAADRSTTTPANDQYKTPATGWGLNAALRRRVAEIAGGRLEWEVGADARFNEGATNEFFSNPTGAGFARGRRAGGETSVAGAYVDGSWTGGDWLVAGGLRYDRWKNEAGFRYEYTLATGAPILDETDEDRSGEVVSARLAARRDLAEIGRAHV